MLSENQTKEHVLYLNDSMCLREVFPFSFLFSGQFSFQPPLSFFILFICKSSNQFGSIPCAVTNDLLLRFFFDIKYVFFFKWISLSDFTFLDQVKVSFWSRSWKCSCLFSVSEWCFCIKFRGVLIEFHFMWGYNPIGFQPELLWFRFVSCSSWHVFVLSSCCDYEHFTLCFCFCFWESWMVCLDHANLVLLSVFLLVGIFTLKLIGLGFWKKRESVGLHWTERFQFQLCLFLLMSWILC